MFRGALLLLVSAVLVVCFQNCSRIDFLPGTNGSSSSPAQANDRSGNGGQPYDGKVYVVIGVCADGTSVESRIELTSANTAQLVRDNCQAIAPVELGVAEFSVDPLKGELYFAGKIYVADKPPVQISYAKPIYYQNSGTLLTVSNSVYVTSSSRLTPALRQQMKDAGNEIVCEVNAGTVWDTSTDRTRFAAGEIGNPSPTQPAERWLDTRSANVRAVIVERLEAVAATGCERILFTQVDTYMQDSGFPLTKATQADYNRFLAFAAHDRKLVVGQLNAGGINDQMAEYFDFAIGGSCFKYDECDIYKPFVAKRKPMYLIEFTPLVAAQCSTAKSLGMSLTFLNYPMNGTRNEPCP